MRKTKLETSIEEHLKKNGWFIVKLVQASSDQLPALLALKDSRSVYIEITQSTNKQEMQPNTRHQLLREKGFDVIIAHNSKDTNRLCD